MGAARLHVTSAPLVLALDHPRRVAEAPKAEREPGGQLPVIGVIRAPGGLRRLALVDPETGKERGTGTPGRQGRISYHWEPKGKGHSIGTDKLTTREKAASLLRLPVLRPTHRDQCRNTPRPCPFISCRSHLYLDVSLETGAIKVNFPGLERRDDEKVAQRLAELLPTIKVKPKRVRRKTHTVQRFIATVRVGRLALKVMAEKEVEARTRLAAKLRLVLEEDETVLDLTQMEETCARDVAERHEKAGGIDLGHGGRLMNVTMERFRQLTRFALDEVQAKDSDGQDVPPIQDDPDDDDGPKDPGY